MNNNNRLSEFSTRPTTCVSQTSAEPPEYPCGITRRQSPAVNPAAKGTDPRPAKVEILTAEVRTLVIGSRQVTLSMLGQMDILHPLGITPMGRVRPRNTYGQVHVIGTGGRGDLARSWMPTRQVFYSRGKAGGWRIPCWCRNGPDCWSCDLESWSCDPGRNYNPRDAVPSCEWCGGSGLYAPSGDGVPVLCQTCAPRPALYDEWTQLPMIVLAGLR